MNFSLLKNIVIDIFLWALIIAGFYLEMEYFDNIAAFIYIVFGVIGILGGVLYVHKVSKKEFSDISFLEQTKMHRQYILWSSIFKAIAIAGSGHFFIAGLLLIGTIFIMYGKEYLVEAYAAQQSEGSPA